MMEGRIFEKFWHTRMAGVVEYPCGIDRIYHFANVEIFDDDILEYDEAGTPVTAWSKYDAPADILQEAKRQEEARQAERNRALDEWRQAHQRRARGSHARSEDQ